MMLAGTLISTSAQAGDLPATGQVTPYKARKNEGIKGHVAVPDDGTLQRGGTLHYKLLNDGTVKDLNTGLIWEVKCLCLGGLHNVGDAYRWSANAKDTIWDWLDLVNAEGGTGYAGLNDWRIPNVRELQSIVDYGVLFPSIDPALGPTAGFYWSSTTFATDPPSAWYVGFDTGTTLASAKNGPLFVRAVRGGPN
jgi:hypothetical protein